MVRSPESDPEYRALFESVLGDIEAFNGGFDPGAQGAMCYLFISSSGSVTPFHVDRYITFLMQLRGSKTVFEWSPEDRETVPEEALETLFARPDQRSPLLADDRRAHGQAYELAPGEALHIPFVAPHWVKNGPEVSVSLSIIYRTDQTEQRRNAHIFNSRLRQKLGRVPTPVGQSPLRARAKGAAAGRLRSPARVSARGKLRALLSRRPGAACGRAVLGWCRFRGQHTPRPRRRGARGGAG